MSETPSSIVIVGAGLAGATAAQTLRDAGFAGSLTMIGDEPSRPYERPPLSKGYLMDNDERESIFVHPTDWYSEHDVDLRLDTNVTAVDRAGHAVVLGDGSRVGYDRLLLTTGSSPRLLDIPGADLDGVQYLRRVEDAEAIKEAFGRKPRVTVIGAGWIGLETTAAAREAGLDVTVLEMSELPLLRVLGPEVAQVFVDLHAHHGVDLRFGVGVAELTGENGTVTGVKFKDGTVIPADLVLVGVGITPNVGLAETAGLDVSNGIDVDEHLCSSDPAVFAAGDVANAWHPKLQQRVRVEHWANAKHEGETAAKAMLGQDASHERLPYFFTDQYDLGMEYTGYVEPGAYDQVVFRGDKDKREFVAFWVKDGRVLAGMNVNVWDVVEQVADIITSGRQVDLSRLADPDVPLTEL